MEIEVIRRWLVVLVQSWSLSLGFIEVSARRRVPCYPKAVDVEEPVLHRDLMLGCYVVWVVRDQFGEVVVVYLFGEGVRLQH